MIHDRDLPAPVVVTQQARSLVLAPATFDDGGPSGQGNGRYFNTGQIEYVKQVVVFMVTDRHRLNDPLAVDEESGGEPKAPFPSEPCRLAVASSPDAPSPTPGQPIQTYRP